ncbi:MAG: SET domain-containing protein-lysine N-methyltransferase [Candidatus Aenigmarchaeota archaeon]|nr:SET domain-containing protein-lysine N-methyltransferase [Candidatus Aenigmarchaeota archaeon]
MHYKTKSFLSPKVDVRNSRLGGKGLFAKTPIKKGEMVIVWGGTLIAEADIKMGRYRKHTAVEINRGMYIANRPDDQPSKDDFMNHSCNPNLWLKDEVTLVAKRNIRKGEELTADYGTWLSRPHYRMKCKCGSPLCRKVITSGDWKRKDIQGRYKNHFSPYLNEEIKKLRKGHNR